MTHKKYVIEGFAKNEGKHKQCPKVYDQAQMRLLFLH